jgi:hypothetical protein
MTVPLECEGQLYGLMSLGPRSGGEVYTQQEGELLARVASSVARAIGRDWNSPAALEPRRNGNGSDGENHLTAAGAAGGDKLAS